MQKASNNNPQNVPPSGPSQPESVQKVLFRLKELHQVEDESRNEMCPVFADEESSIKTINRSSSSRSNHPHPHILKQLQQTEQVASQLLPKPTIPSQNTQSQHQDNDLQLSNAKLKQDNVKLFAECIRLRKKCQSYENQSFTNPFSKKQVTANYKEEILQEENRQLLLKIDKLSLQNNKLEMQVNKLIGKMEALDSECLRQQQKSAQLQHTLILNKELNGKILLLEKQLQLSQSRTISKSSSQNISINNSTQESRKSDADKDRMISNLRVVHESEVRKLKAIIQDLKKEKEPSSSEYGLGAGSKRK